MYKGISLKVATNTYLGRGVVVCHAIVSDYEPSPSPVPGSDATAALLVEPAAVDYLAAGGYQGLHRVGQYDGTLRALREREGGVSE